MAAPIFAILLLALAGGVFELGSTDKLVDRTPAVIKFIGIKHGHPNDTVARASLAKKLNLITNRDVIVDEFENGGIIVWHVQDFSDCNELEINQLLSMIKNPETGAYTRDTKMHLGPDFSLPDRVEVEWRGPCENLGRKRTLPNDADSNIIDSSASAADLIAPPTTMSLPITTPLPTTTTPIPTTTTGPSGEFETLKPFETMNMSELTFAPFPSIDENSTTTTTITTVTTLPPTTTTATAATTTEPIAASTTAESTTAAPTTMTPTPTTTTAAPTTTTAAPTTTTDAAAAAPTIAEPTTEASTTADAGAAANSSSSPHYGKYIGLTTGFLVFIAYLLCARAYRRQGMYELQEST